MIKAILLLYGKHQDVVLNLTREPGFVVIGTLVISGTLLTHHCNKYVKCSKTAIKIINYAYSNGFCYVSFKRSKYIQIGKHNIGKL